MKELLTPAEVAELWELPERTLADWRSRGIGPAFIKLGRHCRYRMEDVLRYEESQRVTTGTPAG